MNGPAGIAVDFTLVSTINHGAYSLHVDESGKAPRCWIRMCKSSGPTLVARSTRNSRPWQRTVCVEHSRKFARQHRLGCSISDAGEIQIVEGRVRQHTHQRDHYGIGRDILTGPPGPMCTRTKSCTKPSFIRIFHSVGAGYTRQVCIDCARAWCEEHGLDVLIADDQTLWVRKSGAGQVAA